MTAAEIRKILKNDIVKKYERLKFKEARLYHNREISSEDLRMRKKFLEREKKIRLAEIDDMNAFQVRKRYEEMISPIDSETGLNHETKHIIDDFMAKH